MEIVKRHSSSHKVNIKYGYILFGLCILLIVVRESALLFYQRAWRRSGRSTTYLRVAKLPTAVTVSLIALTTAVLLAINPHLGRISVLIKRLGRLSYALVPLDLFLAAQPAWFSVDNYLNTIQLHKWVSRLIVVLGLAHGVGFLVYYAVGGEFQKTFRPANFLGFVVFVLANVMMVFWKPIRNFNYKLFYVYHNLFMVCFVVLIYLHARPGVGVFCLLNVLLLAAQYVTKYYNAKDITMTEMIEEPGSDYQIVKFPKGLLPEAFLPASHVRIGFSKWSPLFVLLPSHPYTVATIAEDRNLLASLVIKKSKFQLQAFETYSIQPSFQSSLSPNFFATADNVCIVCGGSGISLGLAVFQHFKHAILADGKDIKLKFIWVTKSEKDLFLLHELNIEGVDVFVTDNPDDEFDTVQDEFSTPADIPLATLSNGSQDSLATLEPKFINVAAVGKRPNLEVMLNRHLSKSIDYANKWVVSCGPPSLNADCERIATKEKCRFFSEEYAF